MPLKLPRLQERGVQRVLTTGFLLVILFLGMAAVVAVGHSKTIRRAVEQLTRDQLLISRLVHDVQLEEDAMVQLLHQLAQPNLTTDRHQSLLTQLDETRQQIAQLLAERQDSPHRALWIELDQEIRRFTEEAHRAFDGNGSSREDSTRALFLYHERVLKLVDDIIAVSSRRLTEMEGLIDGQSRDLGQSTTLLFTLSLLLSIVCAFVTMRFVGRTIGVMRWQAGELNRVSWHMLQTQEEAARRFSHELHDELGQSLAAIRSNLTQQGHKSLDSVRSDSLALVDESIRNVRELSQLLRPVVLDDLGLVAGLRWLARKTSERMRIEIDFQSNTERRLPEEIETHLFRICQEALTNIARHSGATHASIRMAVHKSLLVLTIEDNGCGLPSTPESSREPSSLGLIGMRARARQIGGELEIGNRRPKGLRIRAEVPVPPESPAT